RHLQAGVNGEEQVGSGLPAVVDVRRVLQDSAGDVALRDRDPWRARERRLVELLHPVLPDALAVDEPEQMGGQCRVRPAALLRVHPERPGLEADLGYATVRKRGPDP